jgi:nucleotide-binding universal stress UspA family protein
MLAIKRILLPVDFSQFSKIALPYSIDLAEKFDSDLYLIHVFDENTLNPYYFGKGDKGKQWFLDVQAGFQSMVEDFLSDVETREINIIPVLSNGTPYLERVRYARHVIIDLIVLSTDGRTGLSHALLGGSAEIVIRKSHCPVLTVRGPEFVFEMP